MKARKTLILALENEQLVEGLPVLRIVAVEMEMDLYKFDIFFLIRTMRNTLEKLFFKISLTSFRYRLQVRYSIPLQYI